MFKTLIAKFKLRKQQRKCYKAHKAVGLAKYTVCKGHYNSKDKTPTETCSVCPYFIMKM